MNKGINSNLLIEGCLVGNKQSQKKLFESYYSYVKSICLRYGGHLEDAEEMLNDTFYKVFKFIDRYDKSYAFKPWLRKICVRSCIDYNRKYIKKINVGHTLVEDVGETYENLEIHSSVDIPACLRALSPAYRTVFNLYVFEDYKHQEIADLLKISVNTSKSNLSRAKKMLKKHLEDKNYLDQSKSSNNG